VVKKAFMTYKIYSDGACRGNPGPSGIGAVILNDKGKVVHEISKYIGVVTNNVAEYEALLEALDYCVKKKLSPVEILADSQLMIRQLSGQYKVKHPNMIPLHQKAKEYMVHLKVVGFTHVLREFNKRADELANAGIDNHSARS
jgi:ribonuclease HI